MPGNLLLLLYLSHQFLSPLLPPHCCCTMSLSYRATLSLYCNKVAKYPIGRLCYTWFMFHESNGSQCFRFERDYTRRTFAQMQNVIRADATRSYFSKKYTVVAMSLTDQAYRRSGQRGCADFIRGEIANALAFDHLRSELALKKHICQDGCLHD